MLESAFWSSIRPSVPGRWLRIENGVSSAVPDCLCLVNGVTSMVELKSVGGYVLGLGTTKLQRHWMRRWCNEGGRAYLFARVGGEVLFLWGADVPGYVLSRGEWIQRALVWSEDVRSFDWQALEIHMGT